MLGRGLESLIPNKQPEGKEPPLAPPYKGEEARRETCQSVPKPPPQKEAIFHIEVDKIKPNPHQPRRSFDEDRLNELAASIREMGIIQPLIVLKVQTDTATGTDVQYQLIAGERRWRASKIAGLERVPAIIRRIGQEKEKLEMAIVENVQRTDLNPIEAARSYAKLQEAFGLTQREVASRVGKSRETISNVLRLLNLPSYIQEAISEGKISDSQGRLLLAVSDASHQNRLFEELTRNNMSVRELRSRVDQFKRPKDNQSIASSPKSTGPDPEFTSIEERLQELLGTKVSLQKTTDGGKIVISFFSPEEFKEIIKKLRLS